MDSVFAPRVKEDEFLNTREVEVFAKQCYQTLKKRHSEGHDTGLRKRGRRVVFHVPTLRKFLLGQQAELAEQVTQSDRVEQPDATK